MNTDRRTTPAELTHRQAMLRICIDGLGPDGICGRVYSMRLSHPLPFGDLPELMLELEAVMDAQNYPQAFQRTRLFGPSRPPLAAAPTPGASALSDAAVASATGSVTTLQVQVTSRRHASWQGFTEWPDGHREPFESELELAEQLDRRLRPDRPGSHFA